MRMKMHEWIITIHLLFVVAAVLQQADAQCPDPGGVSNGKRVFSVAGNTVTYECSQGYILNTGGSTYSRTLLDNIDCWNGTTPFCNKIGCGDPGEVTHADKTGSQYQYNDEVTYYCHTGYRLGDLSRVITITCLATGQWSEAKSNIHCTKVSCPVIESVSHGEPPQGTFYYGDTVDYPCQEGYTKRMTHTTLVCQEDGYWSGSYPQCEARSCADPGEPPNSIRKAMSGLQFTDTVTYECLTGYLPFPHQYALSGHCEADGTWSNAGLECKGQLCDVIESVYNSTHTPTTWRYPETVTFTCDSGFQPRLEGNQNDEITCTLQGWDFEPMTCEPVVCSDNGEAQNVEITTTIYRYTQKKTYVCLGGFQLDTGELVRTCQADGRFSGIAPSCRRVGCADPGEFDHSNRTVNGFLFGDIIQYMCFNGYIVGSRSGVLEQRAICTNNGTWDPPLEPCRAAVCGQPDSQGLVVIGTSFAYSDEVTFHCKDGYIPVDTDMTRTCQANGLWDGDPPLCRRRSCGDPGTTPHADKLGSLYTFEEQVFYQCHQGYEIVAGTSLLNCMANGTWNGTKPNCQRVRCPEPTEPAHGLIRSGYDTTYQSIIEYLCMDGFYLEGARERTCEASGDWSGRVPFCEPISCGDPGFINFTYRTGSDFVYGAKVNYSCVLGHTTEFRITYMIKTCNADREWTGDDIVCEPIECPNPGVKNASIQIMDGTPPFYFDDTVYYRCQDGFIILGQRKELYCQHTGLWSAPVPTCTPVPVVTVKEEPPAVVTEVTEAPDAQQYGLVGITLMALEIGTLVLLDLLTISKDLRMLARNIRAGFRKLRKNKVAHQQDKTADISDKDLDAFMGHWAFRPDSRGGASYDDLGSSASTLQDVDSYDDGSTADLVKAGSKKPPKLSEAERLQMLQALAIAQEQRATGDKKKKIQVST